MSVVTTVAFAHKSAAVSNTAKTLVDLGFSQAEVDRASRARITADTQAIRVTYDGTTPTSSVGHYMGIGAAQEVVGLGNIGNLKFIRASGSDGAVSVTLEE